MGACYLSFPPEIALLLISLFSLEDVSENSPRPLVSPRSFSGVIGLVGNFFEFFVFFGSITLFHALYYALLPGVEASSYRDNVPLTV